MPEEGPEPPTRRVTWVSDASRSRAGDRNERRAVENTIKEIMVFMGHADVQTVQRYIKLVPQRDERNPVDRVDSYLRATLA